MAGLTNDGFTRKILTEIIDSIKQNGRNEFGADLNTSDDSAFMQVAGPFSLELDAIWQASEAAYNAYTQNGAEGIHLDNILSSFGTTRLGAQAPRDTVLVVTGPTAPTSQTVQTTSVFTDSNDNTYNPTSATVVGLSNTRAYRVLNSDLALNTSYDLEVTDDNNTQQTTTLQVTDEASKASVLTSIRTFIETHRSDSVGNIFTGTDGLYVGFSDSTTFDLLPTSVAMFFTPAVGNRYSQVSILSPDIGRATITDDDTYTLTPTITGFVESVSTGDAFAGRDIETDAEYTLRYQQIENSQEQSSAVSIINTVEGQTGVVDAVLYENPTNLATTEVPQAYSYHVVVLGGSSTDIATAIHQNAPANVNPYGSIQVTVQDILGNDQVTRFSRASEVNLEIRVDYNTNDGSFLTAAEQTAVQTSLVAYQNALNIGDDFFTFQALGRVISAVSSNRLSTVTINVRRVGGVYQNSDIVATFEEKLQYPATNIFFNKL